MRSSIEKWCSVFNRKIRTEINRRCSKYGLHEANFFLPDHCRRTPWHQPELPDSDDPARAKHRYQTHQSPCGRRLAEKRRRKNDRRKNELFLTQKGRDVIPVLDQIMEDISHESVAGLTDNEAETLEKLLEKAARTYDV